MSEVTFSEKQQRVLDFFAARPLEKVDAETLAGVIYENKELWPRTWHAGVLQFMLKLRMRLMAAHRIGPDRITSLGAGSPVLYMFDPSWTELPRIKDAPKHPPKEPKPAPQREYDTRPRWQKSPEEAAAKKKLANAKRKAKFYDDMKKLAPFWVPGKKPGPPPGCE